MRIVLSLLMFLAAFFVERADAQIASATAEPMPKKEVAPTEPPAVAHRIELATYCSHPSAEKWVEGSIADLPEDGSVCFLPRDDTRSSSRIGLDIGGVYGCTMEPTKKQQSALAPDEFFLRIAPKGVDIKVRARVRRGRDFDGSPVYQGWSEWRVVPAVMSSAVQSPGISSVYILQAESVLEGAFLDAELEVELREAGEIVGKRLFKMNWPLNC